MTRSVSLAIALLVAAGASTSCGANRRDASGGVVAADGGSAPTSTTSAPPTTLAPATTVAPATSVATTRSTTSTVARPATTVPPALSASSRLRIDGIGPIDVGMTVAQARSAAGTELALEHQPYCDILTAPRGPSGVALVVTSPATGRVELVIVKGGPVATVSGIRVGSTEAEVVAAYPGRLRAVNPSWPVHRLIYRAADPALADRVLVFVIDNARVASMYAGVANQAEADEVCG